MKYYSYDKDTLRYKCFGIANQDPIETAKKGSPVYLLPALATFKEVGAMTGDQIAIYDKSSDSWDIKERPMTKKDIIVNVYGVEEQTLSNGVLTNKSISDIDTEVSSLLQSKMRKDRNILLYSTDWSQLSDSPLNATDKTAYVTYRQSLRDLPSSVSDVKNITWPTPP